MEKCNELRTQLQQARGEIESQRALIEAYNGGSMLEYVNEQRLENKQARDEVERLGKIIETHDADFEHVKNDCRRVNTKLHKENSQLKAELEKLRGNGDT